MVLCWKHNLFTPVTRMKSYILIVCLRPFKFHICFSQSQSSSHVEIYFPELFFFFMVNFSLSYQEWGVESRESIKILIVSGNMEKG